MIYEFSGGHGIDPLAQLFDRPASSGVFVPPNHRGLLRVSGLATLRLI
jgi:hypothetical protein